MVGCAPFAGGSEYIIFTKSCDTELFLCPELFSPALRDLMGKMNRKDMNERITIKQAMEHEYFEGVDWDNLPTYETALAQLTPLE
jgi:serine/threonine protein kinase